MNTGNNNFFTLQRPNYLKIINYTSLDQGAEICDSFYLKDIKFIDFSHKKIHIFLKNTLVELNFIVTRSIYVVLTIYADIIDL